MRRANSVEITRFGQDPVNVNIEDGVTTLEEALAEAGMSNLTSSESVAVNGEKIDAGEYADIELQKGDTIQVLGKKEGGLK